MELSIITSPSQIREYIREAVLEAIGTVQDTMKPKAGLSDNELLNERDARAYLGGISKPTLYKLVRTGKITKHTAGDKRTLYSRSELRSYVLNQKTA